MLLNKSTHTLQWVDRMVSWSKTISAAEFLANRNAWGAHTRATFEFVVLMRRLGVKGW